MNKGAVLVSESLLGLDFRVFLLDGEPYRVSPPTIRTICRAIREFGHIELPENASIIEAILCMPDLAQRLTAGLGCFFDDPQAREKLADCTGPQLFAIAQDIAALISPNDFFACAALARNVAEMAATAR